ASTLFRHSAVAKRGGFNTSLLTGEDAALFLRVSLDGPWRHVAGAPVHFRRDLCQRDEGNKSQKYRDCFLQWAKMFEEFFARGGGQAFLADRRYRRLLAARWYRAGQQQLQLFAPHSALQCFVKSRMWTPWRMKYYAMIMRAWWGTIGRPSRQALGASPARL